MGLHRADTPDGKQLTSIDIYWDLRNRLITSVFAPGLRLKPEDLRQEYNCAASTIREVLLRLSADQLVELRDQRGFRTPVASFTLLEELTELRILVEAEGARLSLKHGGLEWEANLSAAHHKLAHVENKMRAALDLNDFIQVWCACEWQFHLALISACGSKTLINQYRDVYDRHRQQLMMVTQQFGYRRENITEHRAILEAALTHNQEDCIGLIGLHMRRGLAPELMRNAKWPTA
ncbi:MAG: GntR family transcriptional regulator [Pikeienuella sp.]